MSKSVKLKNDTYLDTSSIMHNKTKLNNYLNNIKKRYSGTGNKVYLLAKLSKSISHAQLSFYISNLDYYDSAMPGFVTADKKGMLFSSMLCQKKLISI